MRLCRTLPAAPLTEDLRHTATHFGPQHHVLQKPLGVSSAYTISGVSRGLPFYTSRHQSPVVGFYHGWKFGEQAFREARLTAFQELCACLLFGSFLAKDRALPSKKILSYSISFSYSVKVQSVGFMYHWVTI